MKASFAASNAVSLCLLVTVALAADIQAHGASNAVNGRCCPGCGMGPGLCGSSFAFPGSSCGWLEPSFSDPSCCGANLLGNSPFSMFPRNWFGKPGGDLARRSLVLESAHETSKTAQSPAPIRCKSATGKASDFLMSDCSKAASKMKANQLSEAECGTCKLSLRNAQGPLVPLGVPEEHLQSAARGILQSCSVPKEHLLQAAAAIGLRAEAQPKNQFALLLSTGSGVKCS